MVPHYAMSGGMLLALAADEILMDPMPFLWPVDRQVGEFPAASLLKVVGEKDRNELDDKTLIPADLARKALVRIQECVRDLIGDRLPPEKCKELVASLTEGRWTHDYPITFDQAKSLGLPVREELPADVYALMGPLPAAAPGPTVRAVRSGAVSSRARADAAIQA
jgi:ClpP class serine protease